MEVELKTLIQTVAAVPTVPHHVVKTVVMRALDALPDAKPAQAVLLHAVQTVQKLASNSVAMLA